MQIAETRRQVPRDPKDGQVFFTVGHSTRSIPEFVELLKAAEVQLVVDVRSIRRSRTNPQYNEDRLGLDLADYQIGYQSIGQLGGRRGREKTTDQKLNAFWNNRSFHNYADYALTDRFREGLEKLLELGASRRSVIMCAEAVWWRCHRRIIADYLLTKGIPVYHLMEDKKIVPAHLTEGAVPRADGTIVYPGIE
jgi:uncharacterized protein (DUF488 family)